MYFLKMINWASGKIIFRIEETTARSQFLAYYSFTSFNNTQGLGFRPTGGKRIENTGKNSTHFSQFGYRRSCCTDSENNLRIKKSYSQHRFSQKSVRIQKIFSINQRFLQFQAVIGCIRILTVFQDQMDAFQPALDSLDFTLQMLPVVTTQP